MEQLAKAANSAVRNCFWGGDDDGEGEVDDNDDDEADEREDEVMDVDDDDFDNNDGREESDKEEAEVCRLVAKISGWCRAQAPHN